MSDPPADVRNLLQLRAEFDSARHRYNEVRKGTQGEPETTANLIARQISLSKYREATHRYSEAILRSIEMPLGD